MARVMITCPETGKRIYTHQNFNWNTFETTELGVQDLDCPACGAVHVWRRADAYLDEDGRGD